MKENKDTINTLNDNHSQIKMIYNPHRSSLFLQYQLIMITKINRDNREVK